MNMSAVGALIGAVIAVLVAVLLAPLIPEPGGQIVSVIAWIVAAVLLIVGLIRLLNVGPGRRL